MYKVKFIITTNFWKVHFEVKILGRDICFSISLQRALFLIFDSLLLAGGALAVLALIDLLQRGALQVFVWRPPFDVQTGSNLYRP